MAAQMSSTQLTPSMSTAFSLPSFASSFDTAMPPPSHTASPRSSHSHPSAHSPRSSRSNSREPRHNRHFPAPRPYPESNTRTAARDTHSAERPTRKRPAPSDEPDVPQGPVSLRLLREEDHDGDVGMRSDRDQDGDDESSGGSSPSLPHVAVKEEQLSDVEQSPSPPPTPAANANTRARQVAAPPQRYTLPTTSAGSQTHFAPTPPASARRITPPHIALPMLPHPHAGPSSHMTLPPMNFPPPSPSHTHHANAQYQPSAQTQGYTHTDPMLARKRRRVTISGVAANSAGGAQRPLHRTVLERAGSGYGQTQLPAPPGASAGPSTPNATSGMVSPVVTPGFNMNSPGALDQVRDTIAIRMEQKALIEQRKNGGGLATVPTPATPLTRTTNTGSNVPQPPVSRTQGSPSGQSTNLPANTLQAPSTSPSQGLGPPAPSTSAAPPALLPNHTSDPNPPPLTAPPTLAHRRGKNSSKLTIHTPNTSISSSHGGSISNTSGLGLTGTDRPVDSGPGLRAGLGIEVAIRSAPPGVTRFDPATIGRPQPQHPPHRIPPQVPPFKERAVPIRRTHANSTAAQNAPSAPLAIVAPGQPLTLNAPAPPSSYIATPTRAQFPPASQTPHHPPHHVQGTPHHIQNTPHHGHLTPRTSTHNHEPISMRAPASPPISRGAFMAFYDAYAEVHTLRAQIERLEREADRRVEGAVRKMREEMREEMRMLRDEIRRNQEGYERRADIGYPRERDMGYPRGDRDPVYPRERDMREYGREPGPSRDHAHPPPPGPSRMSHPHPRPGMQRSGSASVSQSPMQMEKQLHPVDKPPSHAEKPMDRLHPRALAGMRKSPSGRVQSSMSPPSRPPSVGVGGVEGSGSGGAKTRSVGKGRMRSKSPGNKSGSS